MYNISLEATIPLIIIAGLFSSIIASMIGLGGGLLSVPIIMLIIGSHAPEAELIAVASIVLLSIVAVFKYWRQKKVPNFKVGALISLGVVPLAVIAKLFVAPLFGHELKPYFPIMYAIVIIGVMILINLKDRMKKRQAPLWTLPIFGIGIGFMSGAFGLSGGVLFIPLLVVGLSMDLKKAAVTSLFLKIIAATTNLVAAGASGQFGKDWDSSVYKWLPLIILPGSFIGAFIGPTISKHIKNNHVMILFNVTMTTILLWEIINSVLLFTGIMN